MSDQTHDPGFNAPAGLSNTPARFGSVAKIFHWLTAFLILAMIPLGVVAQYWPYDTSEALATKATLFSLHKTLGLATFAVALLRILWAVVQPRPALLPIDSRAQEFAAAVVHWALYGALVLVPLSGWIHHAASTGFAPIWWPFGQTLFFVPQSLIVADVFAKLHFAFNIVLVMSLVLHIGGALKHHLVDRDATLRRMLPGTCDLPEMAAQPNGHLRPALAAFGIWLATGTIGVGIGLSSDRAPTTASLLAAVPSQWVVESGSLTIEVAQLGQNVTGQFAEWTASIDFSETPTDGQHGSVEILIAIPSLTLGSVTQEALSADFLDADAHTTATFSGPILATDEGFVVDGALTMVGQTHPLALPFALTLDGDTATATGVTNLDRRTYEIGQNYPDESSVGFNVAIGFDLTATRTGD